MTNAQGTSDGRLVDQSKTHAMGGASFNSTAPSPTDRPVVGTKTPGAELDFKAAAAVDAFQDACDRRMAEANAVNQPKESLFHYTNEKAFFNILDSGQLWFTSIYHMDDPEELNFGFDVARSLFKEAAERSKGLARRFCGALAHEGELEKIKGLIAFYSVSFGLRDVGQQWMDYADQGRGVALGLVPEFFTPVPFEDPEDPKPEEIIFMARCTTDRRTDARGMRRSWTAHWL